MKLEDHIDILKEYPFKVQYPRGGSLYFLIWWTDYDRGHALAASSEERIETMLRRVYAKEGSSVKLLDFRHAEIVAPPPEVKRLWALGKLNDDLNQFRWYVGTLFRTASSKDDPVKKDAVRCKVYCDKYSPPEEQAERAKQDKDHSSCINCFGGWLPKGHTVESLYLLKRFEPRRFPGTREIQNRPPDPKRKDPFFESIAPEADPKRKLYALAQHFGDHSSGLMVEEVGFEDDLSHRFPVTFFFHGEKLKIPERFLDIQKTARADRAREEKEKKQREEQKHKHRGEDANQLLRAMVTT